MIFEKAKFALLRWRCQMKEQIDMLQFEKEYISQGKKLVAGIDEAGRGPLAGPVVVASVIMPVDNIIEGINDSKKLSEKKRNLLFDKIKEVAIAYHIEVIDEKVIDEINILNATKLGMKNCIDKLSVVPDIVLIDAVKIDSDVQTVSIIKGDAKSYSIAAASILAKVYRDNLMLQYDKDYPIYNFSKHKGYGTKAHIDAIKEHGICPIHRRTFVKNFYEHKD
ncbi:MAG: ribonuclease HII [Clostridia bacterium]|nr:ribonuclease HII [Clostridia bacterium]